MNLKGLKLIALFMSLSSVGMFATQIGTVSSPDGELVVKVVLDEGKPAYSVEYKGAVVLENSPLGFTTNEGDFSSNLKFVDSATDRVAKQYTQDRIKKSEISYEANSLKTTFADAKDRQISVLFQVSNNNIAFRYELEKWGDTRACVVQKEATGFRFPQGTTSYLSPMMFPMVAFARTSPSYESGYEAGGPIENNKSREGYVFPGLFRVGDMAWMLLTETGVTSQYCAAHLSSYNDGVFTVNYPDPRQNNGFGSTGAQIGLPGVTPWRTITVGETLKPIVETTIPWDVVDPVYEPSRKYEYGKGTWSWIIWQDESMNYADQVKYIDLAAALGYEFILVDAWWDTNMGYEKTEELIEYARSKGVGVFLWYNTNGAANDAFQTPLNKMSTSPARKKEMKWLSQVGVKGIKADFFGGDKQETMRLYEDILTEANEYGLMVVFHGTTLPRGWERMYPNLVGSEAVLASEMLVFSQDVRENEAFFATLHPFIRNSAGMMEFGGVVLNKYFNKGNKGGQKRLTTDCFQLATAVLYQNPVQFFALTPNNLEDAPAFAIDFMRKVPTVWDDIRYVDGIPGKYAVIARRSGDTWYIAGVNAEKEAKKLTIEIPEFAGQTVVIYNDRKDGSSYSESVKVAKNGRYTVTIQPNGGFIMTK